MKGNSVSTTLPWLRYGEARCRSRERKWRLTVLLSPWGEHSMPHRATQGKLWGSITKAEWSGEEWASVFVVVATGRKGWSRVNRFRIHQLNNFSRLWGKEANPGCLVPGPGWLGWVHNGPWCESPIQEVTGDMDFIGCSKSQWSLTDWSLAGASKLGQDSTHKSYKKVGETP